VLSDRSTDRSSVGCFYSTYVWYQDSLRGFALICFRTFVFVVIVSNTYARRGGCEATKVEVAEPAPDVRVHRTRMRQVVHTVWQPFTAPLGPYMRFVYISFGFVSAVLKLKAYVGWVVGSGKNDTLGPSALCLKFNCADRICYVSSQLVPRTMGVVLVLIGGALN
jgi:hypothetical protein